MIVFWKFYEKNSKKTSTTDYHLKKHLVKMGHLCTLNKVNYKTWKEMCLSVYHYKNEWEPFSAWNRSFLSEKWKIFSTKFLSLYDLIHFHIESLLHFQKKSAIIKNSQPEVFCQKGVFKNLANFTRKHLCQSIFFNNAAGLRPEAYNFIKKETLAQVFSCEFCEIFKNTFSYRTPPVAAYILSGIFFIFSVILF